MIVIDKNLPSEGGPKGGVHYAKVKVTFKDCKRRNCYQPVMSFKGHMIEGVCGKALIGSVWRCENRPELCGKEAP